MAEALDIAELELELARHLSRVDELQRQIDELKGHRFEDLPRRLRTALQRAYEKEVGSRGPWTVQWLCEHSEGELLQLPHVGHLVLTRLVEWLDRRGQHLRGEYRPGAVSGTTTATARGMLKSAVRQAQRRRQDDGSPSA